MSALSRAEDAARVAAAAHVETAVRLADEMVGDPTSIDLPRLVDAHERSVAARDYSLAVMYVEVVEHNSRRADWNRRLARALDDAS